MLIALAAPVIGREISSFLTNLLYLHNLDERFSSLSWQLQLLRRKGNVNGVRSSEATLLRTHYLLPSEQEQARMLARLTKLTVSARRSLVNPPS